MLPCILAGALALAAVSPGDQIVPAEGDLAPDFEGTWMNYDDCSLAELQGQLVFLEFWRSW